jgi:hypothetical protein
MNADNILKLAATIRAHENQFNLSNYFSNMDKGFFHRGNPLNDCDTICCICGWANSLSLGDKLAPYDYGNHTNAANFLGLSHDFCSDLFIPSLLAHTLNPPWRVAVQLGIIPDYQMVYSATAEQAAQLLEAIADGRVQTY